MSKYRKKPVVIEATQWHPGVSVEGVCEGECVGEGRNIKTAPHIHTLEGGLSVSDCDWIITGVKGEHYPCKPDIFEATYEAVQT